MLPSDIIEEIEFWKERLLVDKKDENQVEPNENNENAVQNETADTQNSLDTVQDETTPKAKLTTAKKIMYGVLALIAILVILVISMGYHYFETAKQPLHPNSNKVIEVKIPIGSTNKQIGAILEKKQVIKSGIVFDYYVKTEKKSGFKAGYYALKPSMSLAQIAKALQKGGSSYPLSSGKVLIREGVTIDQIGDVIAKNTKFKKKDFLKLVNDQDFINGLVKKYPQLLSSAVNAKNVRYKLEGYLYPATYTVQQKTTLKQLVTQMAAKTDQMLSPYYKQIAQNKMTVHKVLTLASLVEREGVTAADRYKIAGVFENRLEKNMMIQSDISVLYALGKHKTNVTYKDLKVDSPYNLYKNYGVGPGPFNSPSIQSVKAVLNPVDKDKGYLYFIANMKTGKVYFSKTYAEHLALTKKLSQDNN